uniref:Fibronectin type-III domain-containing protein n=1 Tax=uncultured Armatimonadetes bacterium TaxID=157466 RepID=A0A6J4IIB7_9BACT|nr:hypothetical protein AVDCRST_MAG63-1916 [uncultured Armatimonadetes bacterium]
MHRFWALIVAAGLAALGIAGCGGSTKHDVDTGNPNGDLRAVEISPAPGAVDIGRGTTFRLSWPRGNPPSSFSVELFRYTESDEDGDQSTDVQLTDLEQPDDRFVWDLKPAGGADLENGGVYFLRLRSGSDEVEAAYIVSGYRATREVAPPDVPPGIRGAYRHEVRVR